MPKTKNGFLIDDSETGVYKTFSKKQEEEIQALFDAGKDEEAKQLIASIEKKKPKKGKKK